MENFFDFTEESQRRKGGKDGFIKFNVHSGKITGINISKQLRKKMQLSPTDRLLMGYDVEKRMLVFMKSEPGNLRGCELRTTSNTAVYGMLSTKGASSFFHHYADKIKIIKKRLGAKVKDGKAFVHCVESNAFTPIRTPDKGYVKTNLLFKADIYNEFKNLIPAKQTSIKIEELISEFIQKRKADAGDMEMSESDFLEALESFKGD